MDYPKIIQSTNMLDLILRKSILAGRPVVHPYLPELEQYVIVQHPFPPQRKIK